MNLPWHDMFVIPWIHIIEKILRPVLVYIFMIVGLRVAGKRELAQLNAFDLIVLMTLSNTLQNAIIGDDNTITGGVIGAATLLAVNYFVVRFVHHHHKLETLLEGDRDYLMRHGRVLTKSLEGELLTRAELTAACHRQGIASLAEVDSAVMEPTGTITFVQKKPSEEERRHHETMDLIERLRLEIVAMRGDK
jgi:uncharacterized membrane protein YcaP (DUF421 family)